MISQFTRQLQKMQHKSDYTHHRTLRINYIREMLSYNIKDIISNPSTDLQNLASLSF